MDLKLSHKNEQIIQDILENGKDELFTFILDPNINHHKAKAVISALLSENINCSS